MSRTGEERTRGAGPALVALAACALGALLLPAAALASNHLVKLREVYAGSNAHPGDEYVEVQLYASGENFFANAIHLKLYNATGGVTEVLPAR